MYLSESKQMRVIVLGLSLSLAQGISGKALAFDPDSGITKESGPFDLFKFGFFSYKEGRKNGHAGAMGVFGNVLFHEGQGARGLAFMTAALDYCTPKERTWLQGLQEEAFAIASEDERRRAVALAQGIRIDSDD